MTLLTWGSNHQPDSKILLTGPGGWVVMGRQNGETDPTSNWRYKMAMVRCVTEMGMGVDVHGLDYTKAATRAVFDAIHHSSLGFQRMLGKTADDMHVAVTIGVSKPDQVDTKAVLATLPHGNGEGTCVAVQGGLEIPSVEGNDGMLIANAGIIVSFDDGK